MTFRGRGARRRAGRRLAIAALLLGLVWAVPAVASARTITVGPSLRAEYPVSASFLFPSVTVAQVAVAEPDANAVSPVDGVVVGWRLAKQASADSYALRVLRPGAAGAFTGAGTSSSGIASTTAVKSFTAQLPIKAGDAIGIDLLKANGTIRAASFPLAKQPFWGSILGDGETKAPSNSFNGYEFGFNAEVQPAPRVVLVSPDNGSTAGGTSVTIAGSDFTGVTNVAFGSTPATAYAVRSENEITATAPSASAGSVDVTVTSNAGTSPAVGGDRFTYPAPASAPTPAPASAPSPAAAAAVPPTCKVPNLVGKSLRAARRVLGAAHCKLGTVKGEKEKGAKVEHQAAKAGSTRAADSAVGVKLG